MDTYPGLTKWKSHKIVEAGEITEVVEGGCYVKNAEGTPVFLGYVAGMTARYTPVVGDFWVLYRDGYQAISPGKEFRDGYTAEA